MTPKTSLNVVVLFSLKTKTNFAFFLDLFHFANLMASGNSGSDAIASLLIQLSLTGYLLVQTSLQTLNELAQIPFRDSFNLIGLLHHMVILKVPMK